MFQTKEQIITEYLGNVDFNGDWSYRTIQRELHKLIGEEPAINVEYKKDVYISELNSEAKEINTVDKIDIVFSPDLDHTVKTLSFTVGS